MVAGDPGGELVDVPDGDHTAVRLLLAKELHLVVVAHLVARVLAGNGDRDLAHPLHEPNRVTGMGDHDVRLRDPPLQLGVGDEVCVRASRVGGRGAGLDEHVVAIRPTGDALDEAVERPRTHADGYQDPQTLVGSHQYSSPT